MMAKARNILHPADLAGASRLTIDAVVAIADLAEALHHNIASGSMPLGKPAKGATRGITGLVYRSVRGVTRLVGGGIDLALTPLVALLKERESAPAREALIAALNGVLGDHLAASGNPLALSMQWCYDGRLLTADPVALGAALPAATGKVLVLVHGLCMNDRQWLRDDHDHGAALARDLDYTPVYLRYNSGKHICVNGVEFAANLETLIASWPVPVEELVILTHSMGGLVARSALHHATIAGQTWPQRLNSLIFLGTPHHGAPLERGGHWIDTILGVSPYSAPFARIGKIRSAGITDLRYGDLREEDRQRRAQRKRRAPTPPLPPAAITKCYAVAATTGGKRGDWSDLLLGDGLVPVASALGQHTDPAQTLAIPAARRWIGTEMNHMDLLSSGAVYARIRKWLTR